MRLFTKFWGTRGSIPTPGPLTRRYGGNTACVEVRTESTTIICDAGSGLRNLGHDLVHRNEPWRPLHLLLSHTHWDHINGFPFFAPAYLPTTQLHIYDLAEAPGHFYSLLSGQMTSEYFPIRFTELKARIQSETIGGLHTTIGDIDVRAFPNHKHPGGSIGYAFRAGDTKVVYSTDNEIDLMLQGPGRDVADLELRRVDPAFVDFVKDADLLIVDAQFTDAEYAAKVGWGHSSMRTAVDLAAQANVKRLAIFHHDPSRSDVQMEEAISVCNHRASLLAKGLVVFAAREGVELADGAA